MALRKIISYGLLVAFTVLLSPREWWHDCEHHSVKNEFGTTQIDQDDCSICDYHIAVWSLPVDFFKGSVSHIKCDPITFWLTSLTKKSISINFLRGPPVA